MVKRKSKAVIERAPVDEELFEETKPMEAEAEEPKREEGEPDVPSKPAKPKDEELFVRYEKAFPVDDELSLEEEDEAVSNKPGMIFVAVYPMEHDGRMYMPGRICMVPEEEFNLWNRDLERSQARMVMSLEDALRLSASILDGSFVLSPEVSQVQHSMAHGGFGRAKEKPAPSAASLAL